MVVTSGGEAGIGKPRPGGTGWGGSTPESGGSRTWCGGTIIVFMTLDQLRLYGPLGLRIWLKVNRPLAGPRLGYGVVVEFPRGPHQDAGSSEEG